MDEQPAAEIVRFYLRVTGLKRLRRQGWLDRGVADPESVAGHSWGVALLAWLLSDCRDDLDRLRLVELALVHDLAEVLAGDTTPFDIDRTEQGTIPPERFHAEPIYSDAERESKRTRELEAFTSLTADLPADLAGTIRSAWLEYDGGETPEAVFVRQVNQLETVMQAEAYRSDQPDLIIESFWRGARRDVTDAGLAEVLEALQAINDNLE